ncbi:MAG: hypothetical protein JJT81_11850 [Rubellimicrobium sp.]|nr:hypothetical protein [Rubellimicrobium sp.]
MTSVDRRDAAFADVLAHIEKIEHLYRSHNDLHGRMRKTAMIWGCGGISGRFGPPLQMDRVIDLIDQSSADPLAFDAASKVVARLLRQGAELPSEVSAFAAGVITGERKRPIRKGKNAGAYIARDREIACMVEIAARHNLHPTRNDESEHRDSACDVVAEAMQTKGLSPRSYKQVKDIWLAHGGGD